MLASNVKASQALSGEIVFSRLIERLMKIALENAGAERGLLILPSADDYLIQAEARENRLCELVDGTLVEKAMRFEESRLAGRCRSFPRR